MQTSASRYAQICYTMPSRRRLSRAFRRSIHASLIFMTVITVGCTDAPTGSNANSPATDVNSNAGTPAASSRSSTIDVQEPERFSVAMTISIQQASSEAPAPMSTQQFDLAKLDADRRWTFVFPAPLGKVMYLEKSGLKYLVLFERNQYAEVAPNAFGFDLSRVLTPNSIAARFKSHRYEKLGLEPVNGRTAIKYRLADASDDSTHMIFVDQETALPLRSEMSAESDNAKSRVIVEARDVQLNPDRNEFDVPIGMKKVTEQEARPHIAAFANAVRPFADIISGTRTAPAAVAIQTPSNKNAGPTRR